MSLQFHATPWQRKHTFQPQNASLGPEPALTASLTYEELHQMIHESLGINRYLDHRGLILFPQKPISDQSKSTCDYKTRDERNTKIYKKRPHSDDRSIQRHKKDTEIQFSKPRSAKSWADFDSLNQQYHSVRVNPRVSRLENQMNILNVEYGVNWFKFENRIRKVVTDIVEPVIKKNSQIQQMLDLKVLPRIDATESMQRDYRVSLKNMEMRFDNVSALLKEQEQMSEILKEFRQKTDENIYAQASKISEAQDAIDRMLVMLDKHKVQLADHNTQLRSLDNRLFDQNTIMNVDNEKLNELISALGNEIRPKITTLQQNMQRKNQQVYHLEEKMDKVSKKNMEMEQQAHDIQKTVQRNTNSLKHAISKQIEDVQNLQTQFHSSSQSLTDQINEKSQEMQERISMSHQNLSQNIQNIISRVDQSQLVIDENINKIRTTQIEYLERIQNNEKGRIKNADDLVEIREWMKVKHEQYEIQEKNIGVIQSQIIDINNNTQELQLKVFHENEQLRKQQQSQQKISNSLQQRFQSLFTNLKQSKNLKDNLKDNDENNNEGVGDDTDVEGENQGNTDLNSADINPSLAPDQGETNVRAQPLPDNSSGASNILSGLFSGLKNQQIGANDQEGRPSTNFNALGDLLSHNQMNSSIQNQQQTTEGASEQINDAQGKPQSDILAKLFKAFPKETANLNLSGQQTQQIQSNQPVSSNLAPQNQPNDSKNLKNNLISKFQEQMQMKVHNKLISNLQSSVQETQNKAQVESNRFMQELSQQIANSLSLVDQKIEVIAKELQTLKQNDDKQIQKLTEQLAQIKKSSSDLERRLKVQDDKASKEVQNIRKAAQNDKKAQKEEMNLIKDHVLEKVQEENASRTEVIKKMRDFFIQKHEELGKEHSKDKKQLEDDLRKLIENQISKFMMVIKSSEDNKEQNFDFMQQTYEELLKKYVVKDKTDRNMKFKDVFSQIQEVRDLQKYQKDAFSSSPKIIKESFKQIWEFQAIQLSFINTEVLAKCKYRISKCLTFQTQLQQLKKLQKQKKADNDDNSFKQLSQQVEEVQNQFVCIMENFQQLEIKIGSDSLNFVDKITQLQMKQGDFERLLLQMTEQKESVHTQLKKKQDDLIKDYINNTEQFGYLKATLSHLQALLQSVDITGSNQVGLKELLELRNKHSLQIENRQKLEKYKLAPSRNDQITHIALSLSQQAAAAESARDSILMTQRQHDEQAIEAFGTLKNKKFQQLLHGQQKYLHNLVQKQKQQSPYRNKNGANSNVDKSQLEDQKITIDVARTRNEEVRNLFKKGGTRSIVNLYNSSQRFDVNDPFVPSFDSNTLSNMNSWNKNKSHSTLQQNNSLSSERISHPKVFNRKQQFHQNQMTSQEYFHEERAPQTTNRVDRNHSFDEGIMHISMLKSVQKSSKKQSKGLVSTSSFRKKELQRIPANKQQSQDISVQISQYNLNHSKSDLFNIQREEADYSQSKSEEDSASKDNNSFKHQTLHPHQHSTNSIYFNPYQSVEQFALADHHPTSTLYRERGKPIKVMKKDIIKIQAVSNKLDKSKRDATKSSASERRVVFGATQRAKLHEFSMEQLEKQSLEQHQDHKIHLDNSNKPVSKIFHNFKNSSIHNNIKKQLDKKQTAKLETLTGSSSKFQDGNNHELPDVFIHNQSSTTLGSQGFPKKLERNNSKKDQIAEQLQHTLNTRSIVSSTVQVQPKNTNSVKTNDINQPENNKQVQDQE